MLAWVAGLFRSTPSSPPSKPVETIPEWKLKKADKPCDVCGLYTAEDISYSWSPYTKRRKWGYTQICWVCERAMERWHVWSAENLVQAMPNQRAVWIAVTHTNRLRKVYNRRKKLRQSCRGFRPLIVTKKIRELLVVTAKM